MLVGVLLFAVLPSALAQTGDTAGDSIAIGRTGLFSGTTASRKSTWYRFFYDGTDEAEVDVEVQFQPVDTDKVDLALYTGSSQSPRRKPGRVDRQKNTRVTTFSTTNAQEVFIEVKNDESRAVSFVGSVTPTQLVGPPRGGVTVPSAVADTAADALSPDSGGRFVGTVGSRRATWYRFYYGNPGAQTTITANFSASSREADLKVYVGPDAESLTQDPDNVSVRTEDSLSRAVNLPIGSWVFFTVVNDHTDGTPLAYSGRVDPIATPPTPMPTLTIIPIVTPTAVVTQTPQTAPPIVRDERYFSNTGFRIDNDHFWAYFQTRGRLETFGYPVSRTFTFLGCSVQVFQRQVAQTCAGRGVTLLNLLDPDLFRYTRVNGSVFPSPHDDLKVATPRVDDPDYASAILEFVRTNAPDTFEGRAANFGKTFFSAIGEAAAGTSDPNMLGLLNLEVWGAPISRPQRDPGNSDFVYQRFQRGIMHHIASQGVTRGVLLADYLKAILRDRDLPNDLRDQVRTSRYFAQYCPGRAAWVCRPRDLPSTDLTFAFEQG